MGWIANRIESEHRKFGVMKSKHLDWIKIAELKIIAELTERADKIRKGKAQKPKNASEVQK